MFISSCHFITGQYNLDKICLWPDGLFFLFMAQITFCDFWWTLSLKAEPFKSPAHVHLFVHWAAHYYKAVVHKALQQQAKIPLGPLNKSLAFSVPFLTPFVEKEQKRIQSALCCKYYFFFLFFSQDTCPRLEVVIHFSIKWTNDMLSVIIGDLLAIKIELWLVYKTPSTLTYNSICPYVYISRNVD